MNEEIFLPQDIRKLHTFEGDLKFSGGQVMIVGGSKLFHGAPISALKGASRIASMVFFASPESDRGVADQIKASLGSFIWVPTEDIDTYAGKAEAILIGPGMMRSHSRENNFVCDEEGAETRRVSLDLLTKFPDKKWIIDGGSLQVLHLGDIPEGAAITPNKKEFEMLFGEELKEGLEERKGQILELAKKHHLVILSKGAVSLVSDGDNLVIVNGGSDGMVKGGVGDVLAGVAVGFAAKDSLLLSLAVASWLTKMAGEKLEKERGLMFSADDLSNEVPKVWGEAKKEL